ncbi:MAG: hypothetical protein KBG28_27825 [Kofleriaceae bacterium]|nr:hypothetical protein [Kofleriaceae bacterium]
MKPTTLLSLVLLSTACSHAASGPTRTAGAPPSTPALAGEPTTVAGATAILSDISARIRDAEAEATDGLLHYRALSGDLAADRAMVDRTKRELAAIEPTLQDRPDDPDTVDKPSLRRKWREASSYVETADAYLAMLEARAAAEAGPTQARLEALDAAIERAVKATWRGDSHTSVDGFFRPTVAAASDASLAWRQGTTSLESRDRRAAAVEAALVIDPEGVVSTKIEVADARLGGLFALRVDDSATVDVRLVVPGGSSEPYQLVECEDGATDADDCTELPFRNGEAEVAVVGTRSLRVVGPPGAVFVQALPHGQVVPMAALLVGAPPADAPAQARDLTRWGLTSHDLPTRESWPQARALFLAAPETAVVYARRAVAVGNKGGARGTLVVGEPLLMIDGALIRANGEVTHPTMTGAEAREAARKGVAPVVAVVTTERPATLAMPPALEVDEAGPYVLDYLSDLDLTDFGNTKHRLVDGYLAARKTVVACISTQVREHGSGAGYDLVQYDGSGKVKSVRSLSQVLAERFEARCKVAPLAKRRATALATLRGEALTEIAARLGR